MLSIAAVSFLYALQGSAYPTDPKVLARAANGDAKSLDAPFTVPDGASGPIVADFAGLAFEETSIVDFAGPGGQPNEFSRNLISELSSRTGSRLQIRVGGTSLDHSKYDENQQQAIIVPAGEEDENVPFGASFGPSYFDSWTNFDASYVLTVPLGPDNQTQTVAFAKAAFNSVGESNIQSIEIGNEPDLYRGNSREKGYDAAGYAADWAKYYQVISDALGGYSKYQAGAIASPPFGSWDAETIMTAGLTQYRDLVKSIAYHYYQGHQGDDLQAVLMNHTALTNKMDAFSSSIAYCKSINLPFAIAEVGSALNHPVNDFDLESVLGSALWQIDFQLYSMAIGVDRVNMQQGTGFAYAAWLPVDNEGQGPHVKAPYFAQVFVSDFIGKSGSLQVYEIKQDSETLAAYAGYEGGKLAKIAIINLDLWTSSSGTERPSVDYDISVPDGVTSVTARYLTAASGARENNVAQISWDDTTWTYENNGNPSSSGTDHTKTFQPADGKVQISAASSSALIITFE